MVPGVSAGLLLYIVMPEVNMTEGTPASRKAFWSATLRRKTSVKSLLPKYVFFKSMPYARVELARLTNDAGIIGAAMLGR